MRYCICGENREMGSRRCETVKKQHTGVVCCFLFLTESKMQVFLFSAVLVRLSLRKIAGFSIPDV